MLTVISLVTDTIPVTSTARPPMATIAGITVILRATRDTVKSTGRVRGMGRRDMAPVPAGRSSPVIQVRAPDRNIDPDRGTREQALVHASP